MPASRPLTQAQLEKALASAGIGCWTWNESDRTFRAVPGFAALLGLSDDIPDCLELLHPDDRPRLQQLLQQTALPTGEVPAVRLRNASGLWSWFEIRLADQDAGTCLLTFREISQTRQIEAAARDSQLRYRALSSTAPLAFVVWDRQGHISEWNRRAEHLFGWDAAQVIGKRVHHLLLPEETHADFSRIIKALIHDGGDGCYNGPALTRDGNTLHCSWYSVALRSPSGQLLGILSLILDQTAEYQGRRQLERSEATYRTLVETSPDAILLLTLDGRIQTANQEACQLFGLDRLDNPDSVDSRTLIGANADAPELLRLLEHPEDFTGYIATHELTMRNCTGRQFSASTAFTTIADRQGKPRGMVLFVRDITERLRADRELETHRRHLEQLVQERTQELQGTRDTLAQIIDGSPVPAFVLDKTHRITHWNKACEQIIGMSAKTMIGTSDQWRAFYNAPRPVMADLLLDNQMSALETLYGEHCRPSSLVDGGYEAEAYFGRFDRWLFFTAAPLRNASGEIIGAIETLQDISERKRTEVALKEATAHAESAARAKADFMANMSHEIRTPMNAVIGLAHLLLRGELSGKQRDYVSRIQGAGQMLLGLINDILDFSKIEAGCMLIESTEFNLDDVLDNVATVVLQRAQEKGLELHYVVNPELPSRLLGDPLRLAQILINLIGNAIKFTARGSVTVFLRPANRKENRFSLEVDVQDTGIGMTPEHLGKLFQAFSQADTSITRKYGGSGLGLTICKRLTEMMGGDIWVASQPDVGSTFSFNIQLGIVQTTGSTASNTIRRALVVDDNPLARNVLIALLKKQGCQAEAAASGEEALRLIEAAQYRDFDCITLDLNMPGMDGLELADILRQRCQNTPQLVLITAADTAALAEEHRLSVFDAILHKPITAAQISRLLNPLTAEAGETPHRPAPLAGLHVLLVEDIPTNQLIARELLEALGVTVSTANNGREAVEEMANNGSRYDLILMDIQMPEMDGLEATRRLRAAPQPHTLPIIAMTAHALEEEKQRCTSVGMNDFITKPIDPEQLRQTLLRHRPASSRPQAQTPPPAAASEPGSFPALAGIDIQDGLRRMMNKTALYERVLRDFHARFRDEATNIRQALAAGDRVQAERRAHSTKGLAGTIGAGDLQKIALALETGLRQQDDNVDKLLDEFERTLQIVTDSIAEGFKLATPPGA